MHVFQLDAESERRLARALDVVRERAHDARRRKHRIEVRITLLVDEGGHVLARSKVQFEEPLLGNSLTEQAEKA